MYKELILKHIVIGDILDAKENIICHQVNTHKKMASGIAKKIREKWPIVYEVYKEVDGELGDIGVVFVSKIDGTPLNGANDSHKESFIENPKQYKCVFNIYSQNNYGYDGKLYTNYDVLRNAMKEINKVCNIFSLTLAIPYKIGCGLGGGDWDIVSQIIVEELTDIDYTIYKLHVES